MEGVCVCAKEGEMWWEVQENLLTIPVIPNRYVLSNLCVKYSETKQTHRQQNSLSKMKRRTGEIHHYQRYPGEIRNYQRFVRLQRFIITKGTLAKSIITNGTVRWRNQSLPQVWYVR